MTDQQRPADEQTTVWTRIQRVELSANTIYAIFTLGYVVWAVDRMNGEPIMLRVRAGARAVRQLVTRPQHRPSPAEVSALHAEARRITEEAGRNR